MKRIYPYIIGLNQIYFSKWESILESCYSLKSNKELYNNIYHETAKIQYMEHDSKIIGFGCSLKIDELRKTLKKIFFFSDDVENDDDDYFKRIIEEICKVFSDFDKSLLNGEHNFVPIKKYEQFYNNKLRKYEKFDYEIREIIDIIKLGRNTFTLEYEQFRKEDIKRPDFDATKFPKFVNNISILEKLYEYC